MYGMYPFEGKFRETVVAAIVTGRIRTPRKEVQEQYSEGLKKTLSLLLSQVLFIILNI
jgi:hypothetical protein